ncbi:MAG: LPS assembly lipoprotein LptE [candidate division KSB1 bacterium]|nr:LPS assembly lipoprotein LptE [candidate division KSB1 bacterium]
MAVSLLTALCALLAGCGVYSFSGSANPHLKTVAVPIFDDRTAEFGVKEQLTEAIIASFNRDNTLKLADRRVADVIVNGTILRLHEQAGVYTAEEQVQEIRVYLTVKIKCDDVKKRKVLWEEELTQFGTYTPAGANSGDRQSAISSAIAKIATEVLNRTVSGW